jgi:hypothetical protein
VVGAETIERALELGFGSFTSAFGGLASQEHFLPVRFQCGAQPFLCVPIRRGDVKVVDAPFHGLGDNPIRVVLFHVCYHNAAKSDQ